MILTQVSTMKKAGDKQQAICYSCGDVTQPTFAHRDVPLSGTDIVAKNILVASCDVCGQITATPQQSADDVRSAIEINESKQGIV